MTRLLPVRALLVGAAVCAGAVTGALAQTNDDIFGGLQFNFLPPGARSLATAGAFVGRADDATAAYSNPAGLLWLAKPEISVELRSSSYSTTYLNGGRVDGEPSLQGIDTVQGPVFSDFDSDTSGVSFLSYAHPSRSGKWAVAFYRHELANFEVGIRAQGTFAGEGPRTRQTGAMIGDLDLLIENYGLSGAWSLGRNVWLGLGVSLYRLDIEAQTRRFEPESLFEEARFSDSQEFIRRRMTGDSDDVGLIGGLLWRSRDRRWSAGVVYREGPELDVDTTFDWGPLAFERDRANQVLAASRSGPTTFHVPDVLAAGFSVRPTPSLTVSFEYDHVEYSNLSPEKNVLVRSDPVEEFRVDDADQLHLGLEYVLLNLATPLVLRAGAWSDPDHQLVWTPQRPGNFFSVRYAPGDDVIHLTGGLGLVFKEGRFQLDLAFDTSDRADILTLSSVVTF